MYLHTQDSPMIRLFLGAMLTLGGALFYTLWVVAGNYGDKFPPLAFLAVLPFLLPAAALWQFVSLTVSVEPDSVFLSFGPGLIKKRFQLSEVESVAAVRNSWLHGWGIHYIGKGWLYNVAGLEAVELRFRNGKIARIGTDEPAALEAAIRSRLPKAGRLSTGALNKP